MEDLVIETLAESGFEAELDIVSVTRTRATIRNIRLRRDNEDVLRARELRAQYVWPDIRDGQLERLELENVNAHLVLGEDWQPAEDWLVALLTSNTPNEDQPDTPARFPKNGVSLKDGTLRLISPVGDVVLYVDANVPTAEIFDAEVTLAPSALSYRGFKAQGAGFAKLGRQGSKFTVEGQTQTDVLSNSNVQIEDATLRLNGAVNLDTLSYTGLIAINGDRIDSKLFAADAVDLNWDGTLSQDDGIRADGQWAVAGKAARTPRPARADELAETLSLASALRDVPVTEHYTPILVKTVRDFLVGSDVSGTGQLSYGPTGFTVTTSTPVTVQTPQNRLTLTPRKGAALYEFNRTAQRIDVQLDAGFTNPTDLKLSNIQLSATSTNGLGLDGINSFSTDLVTSKNWRVMGSDQRPVRLGPLRTKLAYLGDRTPRQLAINTDLNFDGGLPGGYVKGLTLQGRLDVALHGGRQIIGFAPAKDGQVTFSRMETPTAWIIEDGTFLLSATRSLFVKTAKVGTLNAALKDATFTLTQPSKDGAPAQRLDLQTGGLSLKGQIFPSGQQDWETTFTDAIYSSDTLPGPSTKATASSGELTAKIAPNAPVEFTLKSPAVSVQTPLVDVGAMQIDLGGTPDTYKVTHRSGTIRLIGTDFAETARAAGLIRFPADGVVQFMDGQFTGQANLRVAKANNAEMIVDYSYANGAGTAAILIPSIKFTSGGLQPQALFPTLKGKIASVEGEAQARLKVEFANRELTQSSGVVDLLNVNLGTAPGPIEGLNTSLTFTSLLPLATDGPQTLTMKSFNPGLLLQDGEVTYRLVPEGVGVDFAEWPIGNGALSLDPFTWLYATEENRVTMRVKDVSLGDFLKDVGNSKIEATGTVVGTFPIIIRGIEVLVDGGAISVPDGGVLRVDPGPSAPVYSQEDALAVIRENRTDEYAALARDALREFKYRELSAAVDGPLDGELQIGLNFDGSNDRVLNSQPFRFDVSVAGELFNIARSFNSNAQIKSKILRENAKLPEGVSVEGQDSP